MLLYIHYIVCMIVNMYIIDKVIQKEQALVPIQGPTYIHVLSPSYS